MYICLCQCVMSQTIFNPHYDLYVTQKEKRRESDLLGTSYIYRCRLTTTVTVNTKCTFIFRCLWKEGPGSGSSNRVITTSFVHYLIPLDLNQFYSA